MGRFGWWWTRLEEIVWPKMVFEFWRAFIKMVEQDTVGENRLYGRCFSLFALLCNTDMKRHKRR